MTELTTVARPQAASLLSHAASHLIGVEDLVAIPAGPPTGPRHRPVPHIDLVAAVKDAFTDRGYAVSKELYAVSHENARLFGTLDLVPTTGASLTDGMDGGMAVGLRHANDQAFGLGVIAGLRVFVCDNLCFSGTSLLRRKHTTGLDLTAEVRRGIERSFGSYRDLGRLVENLKNTPLSDADAQLLIYRLALEGEVVSPSQLGKVHTWYFRPEEIASDADLARGLDDVVGRTGYGVLSAVTRVLRGFSPARQQETGVHLSAYLADYFHMTPYEARVPEAS